MIIQKLNISDGPLYLKYHGNVKSHNGVLVLDKSTGISTNTYFNACSVGKWFHYCDIDKIVLNIEYSGCIRIEVVQAYYNGTQYIERSLCNVKLSSDARQLFRYEIDRNKKDSIYYKIKALDNDSKIYNAFYECEAVKEREINIALNICTYKRERYLMKNISLLQERILKNIHSPLYGHLKVFITDNAGTIAPETVQDDNIFICHNPNIGGAGGFTRGLLEILNYREDKITNVIFMDDDVEIEVEGIVRTFCLLKLLKNEFLNSFIAGAMLRLDKPYIQHENGALWNMGNCKFVNRGLNLRHFKNVVYNELDAERDYAAWWFCCIPMSVVSPGNLPLPVFIHQDDTEYSLRNAKNIITMNGIAIWHEAADNKRISTNEYYNFRNMMIVNSRYCDNYSINLVKKQVRNKLLTALLRYRYKDMYLIIQAVEDFCGGPEWLFQLNAADYHRKLQEMGYTMQDITEYLDCAKYIVKSDASKTHKKANKTITHKIKLIFCAVTLNGWLFPAKKGIYAVGMGVHPMELFRINEVILYDDVSNQGIVVNRQFSQIFVMLRLYVRAKKIIRKYYNMSVEQYKQDFYKLQSIKYWQKAIYGHED